MTSKQRVLTAIDHQEPDRVPLDYSAWREVSEKLCTHLGIDPACEYTHFQEFPEALMQRFHIDIRVVRARYIGAPPQTFEDGSYIDMFGIHQSRENYPIAHPLSNATSVVDIEAYRTPDPEAFDYEHLSLIHI